MTVSQDHFKTVLARGDRVIVQAIVDVTDGYDVLLNVPYGEARQTFRVKASDLVIARRTYDGEA